MKVLAIAGKVDSRILAYPLARALSIKGLTALVSEDGAYRRLYHGDELSGTVSGIDISIGVRVDDELIASINDNGLDYEHLIVVTGGHIPTNVDGVILCKGIDKSMSAKDETKEKQEETKKVKKSRFGKKTEEENEETEEIKEKTIEETKEPEKVDEFIVPESVPSNECYISFERPDGRGELGIALRDSAIRYIYNCEETKQLDVLTDKGLNRTIVQIASKPLGIDEKELLTLMTRKEYSNTGKIK